MSYTSERHDISRFSNQSLSVSQCGITICESGHSVSTRIYGHYSAHFIIEGKGVYTTNGKSYELSAGQGFLIIPDVPNSYVADESEPWKYIYASFCGPDDKGLVRSAGLNQDKVTFDFDLNDETLHELTKMYKCGRDPESKGYDIVGHFLIVMSQLVKASKLKKTENYLPEHYLTQAITYIEDNYPFGITVNDIASHIGIDRTYLYRLFLKNINISPTKYLLYYKLDKAKLMMAHEYLSLNEIATATGFYDVSHFSKAFSSKYGIAPGKYRLSIEKEEGQQ